MPFDWNSALNENSAECCCSPMVSGYIFVGTRQAHDKNVIGRRFNAPHIVGASRRGRPRFVNTSLEVKNATSSTSPPLRRLCPFDPKPPFDDSPVSTHNLISSAQPRSDGTGPQCGPRQCCHWGTGRIQNCLGLYLYLNNGYLRFARVTNRNGTDAA